MIRSLATPVLVLAGLTPLSGPAPVAAQDNPYVGRWRCEHAAYTNRNVAADNYTISWVMDLMADGTYVAQGQFFSQVVGYPDAMQAQGRWRVSTEGIGMEGSAMIAGSALPFNYALKANDGTLLSNTQSQIGRTSTICERFNG